MITVHIAVCACVSACELRIRAFKQGYSDDLLGVAAAREMGKRRATGQGRTLPYTGETGVGVVGLGLRTRRSNSRAIGRRA